MKLTRAGFYTPEARVLMRVIAQSGCAREKVGKIMIQVAKFFGITIKNAVSRRTVSRAILEGGIAAKVQLGYEIAHANSKLLVLYQTE